MEITTQNADNQCQLQFSGEMSIYSAMENKAKMAALFEVESDIALDASNVSEMDSSGFQMLLLLERQAAQHQKKFRLSAVSPVVQEVVSLYGKDDWIDK